MTINFIPNDPLAANLPLRKVAPRPERASAAAGFVVDGTQPAALYPVGTPGFLRWQSRQAAMLAVEAWEAVLGRPITSWVDELLVDPRRLPLHPDSGEDLNAFYQRDGLFFWHRSADGTDVDSGASTDLVAHEVGHAVLDVARPDLWLANFAEVAAFHEAFGDITAIVTALHDRRNRVALLAASADLGSANSIEAVGEQLANGYRLVFGVDDPSAEPRRAFNTYRWQLPESLPSAGRAAVLTSEAHSFGRVMSGCFWTLLRALLVHDGTHDQAALWRATRDAGRLLHRGAESAVLGPRWFRAVGRAMVLADQSTNGGANRDDIGKAFADHGIALGSSAAFVPESMLAGAAPRAAGDGDGRVEVHPSTVRDLRRRLGAPAAAVLSTAPIAVDGATTVGYRQPVALDDLDPRLVGAVAMADIHVTIGSSGNRAAVLGPMPEPEAHGAAVRAFVATLVTNDQIVFDPPGRSAPRVAARASAAAGAGPSARLAPSHATHELRREGRAVVLRRVRFTDAGRAHGGHGRPT